MREFFASERTSLANLTKYIGQGKIRKNAFLWPVKVGTGAYLAEGAGFPSAKQGRTTARSLRPCTVTAFSSGRGDMATRASVNEEKLGSAWLPYRACATPGHATTCLLWAAGVSASSEANPTR